MEFAGIIAMLMTRYTKFEMIVGHSLGGVASLHAIKDHDASDKLTMIASPSISEEILLEYERRIGASRKCEPYFQQYVFRNFGKTFEEYAASHIITEMKGMKLQLIYDKDDKEISIRNAEVLKAKYPEAKLIVTQGLGHTRILKENEVIQSALAFVKMRGVSQFID